MRHFAFEVLPALREHVQLVWGMESEGEGDGFPREQILPDGIVELVLHYGEPFYTYQDGEGFLQPRRFAVSMMRKCLAIESAGQVGIVAVRFYPWGAYHFFATPIKDFLDRTIDADLLWPGHVRELVGAVTVPGDAAAKAAAVQGFLVDRLGEHPRADPGLDAAVKLIRNAHGSLRIEEVCAQTGFTPKQLERRFTATVGTTPKVFSRISRFLSICQQLQECQGMSLTELAYACGLYDQAHFIKEFKDFSGFTPKEFFAREDVVFSEI